MKKNKILFSLTLLIIFYPIISLSDSFIIKSSKMEILDNGNTIISFNGRALSDNGDLEISSERFEYLKEQNLLKSNINGLAIIKSKKLNLMYENAIFDQKKLVIEANENVKIFTDNKNLIIESNQIFFDRKKNIISSSDVTQIKDSVNDNTHYVDSFKYEIDKDLIKVKNLVSKDASKNLLKTSVAYINTKSGKIFGKDIEVELTGSQNKNPYRLKGNSAILTDKTFTEIKKGVFTSCQKRDSCSPWQLSANKILHDKKKKEISYEDAVLRLYNFPIAYFPKFFHPDPTVERKSGFLIPSFNSSSNSGNYINIPFFYAISENRDFTFSPRFYDNDTFLIQTEYRQNNKNSNHIADFSFFSSEKNKSKSHFFYNLNKDLNIKNFDKSNLELNLQSVSNDTYLKSNKVKNEIVKNFNVLENSFNLDIYSNNMSVNLNSTVFEDLTKNKSDKYEYILPKILLTKKFDNNIFNLNGNLNFNLDSALINYDTNVHERYNVNSLNFKSNPKINKFGFVNDYEFLVLNNNSDNKRSDLKNGKNLYFSGIYQFNSSLPMVKQNQDYQNLVKPKLSLKFAPDHTVHNKNSNNEVNVNNVYSLNRTADNKSVEGGISATYGIEYSSTKKTKSREVLNIKLANNIRLKENADINSNNQLHEKTSNIFNEINYSPNQFFSTKYTSSIKNNLKDISYENLISEFSFKNFITNFDYVNENENNKNTYISNNSKYSFNSKNSLQFSTRKNKSKDLTEYYKFMYQYKIDCLTASIEYDKNFYNDRDLKPEKNIFFKLSLIPFTSIKSPNIEN